MRIARVEADGVVRAAIVSADGESVSILPAEATVLDLLGPDREAIAASGEQEVAIGDVRLLAPLKPPAIRDFSVFEQHSEGMLKNISPDASLQDSWYLRPMGYLANPHAVSGPSDEIPVPPGCTDLDLELEVAAVVGRAGRHLSPEQAQAHIAGYTIFNDWSARDILFEEILSGAGVQKGKDFANTLGPWIVTVDELERYRVGDRLDLDMRASINGSELGDDTLANMAWSFEELVSYASRGTWVQPGDIIASGTCGYGCLAEFWGRHGRDGYPPLRPGDTVALNVEGIGTLTNTIVEGVDELVPFPKARPGRLRSRATA